MIELCLETSSAFSYFYAVDSALSIGWHRGRRPFARRHNHPAIELDPVPSRPEFDMQVRQAAGELPFRQAEAIWLVDVCGYDYERAATEARTSRDELVRTIADARRSVRSQLTHQVSEPASSN